ncbi:hypothetical protein [Microterricola viridarii]|uniref:Uncharacterized protein n=1 Tax=Microterricola viridarii TaxID=412690 RepID=A0A1H1PEN6_9MICO|nr:hypothetical protein [Microterricola viridarii]SDS09475.1 hypothetical protein SAMN04489834_0851 [Microterricola viridarii]
MKSFRAVAALLLAATVVVGISACASTPGAGSGGSLSAVEDYSGLPEGMVGLPQNPSGEPQLYWLQDGAQIGITLWGSSTCPPIVESLTQTSSNAFTATQAELPAKPCTRDLVPHTTVFTTPSDTATSSDVTIVLDGTSLTLPGRR